MNLIFQNPYSDSDMTYDITSHRYILTEEFVRNQGIDLNLILETEMSPDPANVPALFLNRVSLLVYSNIYNYGRQFEDKQYLISCGSIYRDVIKEAMLERVMYIYNSGDLSSKSGALISQGTRVEVKDLIPSVTEEMILRSAGLLHRGSYQFIKDESLVY
jgi:hypothetical protein